MTDVHSCSYYCDRSECIKAQRDELRERLAQPEQEPVAWAPIEQPYPLASKLDILMGDGSILCGVLPQAEGDLWWPGTGEKFIDPQYANVTHWRIHSNTAPPRRKWVGLTDGELWDLWNSNTEQPFPEWFEDFKQAYKVIEARLREKNDQSIVSGS